MIISISGTPGTGKTEVAKALAERLECDLIELNRLAEDRSLYAGYDDERKCKIVDIDKIRKEVKKLAKTTKNLVLESHYAHDMPCDVAVILRTKPGELKKRLIGKKGWNSRKIEENIQAEIMEVSKSEALEQGRDVLEIDTTDKTPNDVAEYIMNKLKNKI